MRIAPLQRKIISVDQAFERATWRWTRPNDDNTHDFTQCYNTIFLDSTQSADNTASVFGKGLIYPLYVQNWAVDSRTSEFILVFGITV